MRRIFIFVLAGLLVAACSEQAPEITAQDQVPADQRTQAAGENGTEEGAAGEQPGGEGTWVAVDIDYASAPETVAAGDVEVTLNNDGSVVHDVTFEELGDETVVSVPGGESDTAAVTLEPGTYTYYCSVPGHRAAGMEGELTAE